MRKNNSYRNGQDFSEGIFSALLQFELRKQIFFKQAAKNVFLPLVQKCPRKNVHNRSCKYCTVVKYFVVQVCRPIGDASHLAFLCGTLRKKRSVAYSIHF